MTPDLLDRVPPHNLELEQALLGAIMHDPLAFDEAWAALKVLGERCFYSSHHRTIWNTIRTMLDRGEVPEFSALLDELARTGARERAGGGQEIRCCLDAGTLAGDVCRLSQRLADYAVRRETISALQRLAVQGYEPGEETGRDYSQRVASELSKVAESAETHEARPFADLCSEVLASCADGRGVVGYETSLAEIHTLVPRFRSGELIIVAGPTGHGKSSLMRSIVRDVANARPVVIFAYEENDRKTTTALLASEAWRWTPDGRPLRKRAALDGRLTREQHEAMRQAAAHLQETAKLVIDPSRDVSVQHVCRQARRYRRKHGPLGALMVDYLQLMSGTQARDGRVRELGQITMGLKNLAEELEAPIFLGSQINRTTQKGTWKESRPRLSDLRDSGSIEQDADVVLFVWRRDRADSQAPSWAADLAEVWVAKDRSGGSPGVAILACDGARLYSPTRSPEEVERARTYRNLRQ